MPGQLHLSSYQWGYVKRPQHQVSHRQLPNSLVGNILEVKTCKQLTKEDFLIISDHSDNFQDSEVLKTKGRWKHGRKRRNMPVKIKLWPFELASQILFDFLFIAVVHGEVKGGYLLW